MRNEVWGLVFKNYMGKDETVYFSNYEIAKKNFDFLRNLYKHMPEFKISYIDDSMSWHDHNYNQYDTQVYLYRSTRYSKFY